MQQTVNEGEMERFVIHRDDEWVAEVPLQGKRLSIGRDPASDVPLNDLSVSRHHAQLLRIFNDYYIEDLQSTNGTLLNERKVTKHILQHDDLLQVGSFTLRYLVQDENVAVEDDLDRTVVLQPVNSPTPIRPKTRAQRVVLQKVASLRFFRGPNQGLTERIERSMYTIGQPGAAVAVIARRPQGFFLLHIGGDYYPKINSQEIDTIKGVQLHEGDVIEVGSNLAEINFL